MLVYTMNVTNEGWVNFRFINFISAKIWGFIIICLGSGGGCVYGGNLHSRLYLTASLTATYKIQYQPLKQADISKHWQKLRRGSISSVSIIGLHDPTTEKMPIRLGLWSNCSQTPKSPPELPTPNLCFLCISAVSLSLQCYSETHPLAPELCV